MSRHTPPHIPLAAVRKRLGYTQTEIADRAQITQAQLARIETGVSGASSGTLRALEEALALHEGDLTTAYRPRTLRKRPTTTNKKGIFSWFLYLFAH